MAGLHAAAAFAVITAVARTLLMGVAGLVLARYRATAGGAASWRDLARVNAEFFMPCLVLANFPKGIDIHVLHELWPVVALLVVLSCMWFLIGAIGGWLLLARDQRHLVGFVAVSVAYPNSFAIPYPLMLAMIPRLDWLRDQEDPEAFCAAVLMLGLFVYLLQVWTVGFTLYGRAAAQAPAPAGKEQPPATPEPPELEAQNTQPPAAPVADDASASCSETSASEVALGGQPCLDGGSGGAGCVRGLQEIINPLTVSLVLAFLVVMSPLRGAFVTSPLFDALDFVAEAAVPLTLVQIGAGMARPPAAGEGFGDLRWRSALLVVFLRLVVANVTGSAVVAAFQSAGLIKDRLVALCMYCICCSPTAPNLSVVSGVQDAYVQPTAMALFAMSVAAVPVILVSVTVYVVILTP
mmetsp:Transcript_19360/g.55518  ORF Transcript_19360/g.55518 Transcript_19360/m.55518 type:complete len:409 (+) Transcript_19360:74-1300(+)